MSFVVGYANIVQYKESDTTSVDAVLEALRASNKGKLVYPEPLLVSINV